MSSYRHNGLKEEAGDIGFNIKETMTVNGMICVHITHPNTTMFPSLTHEIERIANAMRATQYVNPSQGREGFDYTFGEMVFGH